ncbi:MAG: hypothetical protein P4M01_08540 [Acidobacteriota bacterium]|nr:hypothetical protein [Acidobacteriota bacterium]
MSVALAALLLLLANAAWHRCSASEQLLSARVYWNARGAIITLTTTAEVHREGLLSGGLRRVAEGLGLRGTPRLYVGESRVIVLRDGRREDLRLPARESPAQFPLWPYYGHLYTWETETPVREWSGQSLGPVPAPRAAELRKSFPHVRDNYAPAASPTAPDILQDVVSREEWRAYQHLADLPGDVFVSFPVAGENCVILASRGTDGSLALTLLRNGHAEVLWQPARGAHTITAAEFASYVRPLPPGPPSTGHWLLWTRVLLAFALCMSLAGVTVMIHAVSKESSPERTLFDEDVAS